MGYLRKRLSETIPALADALERSWAIVIDEWLPAMSPQMDSYNAYPHLRNHEKHLERIWFAYEEHHGASAPLLLSPIEIYVLLSSGLFHDIGRTLTGANHGDASQVIIVNGHESIPRNPEGKWHEGRATAGTESEFERLRGTICSFDQVGVPR